MRIVLAANPGLGHVLPLLPLALAARDAGHDAVVIGGRGIEPTLAAVGLAHVEAGPPDLASTLAAIPEVAGRTGRSLAVTVWSRGFAGIVAPATADALLGLAKAWRPDIVVHDDSEQGTWIAAERLGVPHIALQVTAWRGPMRRLSEEPLGRLIAHLGLPVDPRLDRWHRHGFLVTRPAALRSDADPVPQPQQGLRPVALDDAGVAVPPWLEAPRARPRIAVTLGTVGPGRADAVAALVQALVPLGAEIVATVGSDIDPASLGPVPAGVHIAAYLPMSRLLQASDVVVCHGGSGTMLAALAAGIPLVMLPAAADQPENAARCEAAGVAIALPVGSRAPQAIRDAVVRLLGEPAWAENARRVQAQIAAMPAPAAVLPAIERLAAAGADGTLEPLPAGG